MELDDERDGGFTVACKENVVAAAIETRAIPRRYKFLGGAFDILRAHEEVDIVPGPRAEVSVQSQSECGSFERYDGGAGCREPT